MVSKSDIQMTALGTHSPPLVFSCSRPRAARHEWCATVTAVLRNRRHCAIRIWGYPPIRLGKAYSLHCRHGVMLRRFSCSAVLCSGVDRES